MNMRERMSIFGMDMARRVSRRSLVAATYLGLALVCVVTWTTWGTEAPALTLVLTSCLVVNAIIFGGYARGGLIKPFATCTPAGTPTRWHQDERELGRRDRMHFYAYRIVVVLALLAFALGRRPFEHSQISHVLLLATVVLGLTLPQALLLWNEPDVDAARD
jgi:hypothetical protein